MSKILIFSEVQNGAVKPVTLEILGKLTNQEVDIAVMETINDEQNKILASYGANKIFTLKGDGLDKYTAEGYSHALKDFLSQNSYDYVFAGATSTGKDFIPRLAASFEAGVASDVIQFSFDGDLFQGIRPLFAGKCLAKVKLTGPKPHFVTIRPNALGMPDNTHEKAGEVSEAQVSAGEIRAILKEIIKGASEKADLTEARVIVSGGRAMKDAENFKILEDLADVLGATVGASRAAVDSGFAPHSMQVGQTGKTVAPNLYIACGISGAIQHLAGMRTSKVIVAINTDPEAPIFSRADYGIVGDLFQIVPLMTQELKKLLS